MMGEYVYSTQPEGTILILGRSGQVRFLQSGDEVERFRELLSELGNPWDIDSAVEAFLSEEGKEN